MAAIRFPVIRQIAVAFSDHPQTKLVTRTFVALIGLRRVLQTPYTDRPQGARSFVMTITCAAALIARSNKVSTSA